MSRVNEIQRAILGLSGGEYQKMMDAYFYKKLNLKNIQTLGSRTGSNKVTKGIPDTYSLCDDGTYILIMYGSVKERPFDKIKDDILSCFNKNKLDIPESKIKKIICAYTSTNLRIEQISNLKELIPSVKIELIGIDTVSHDLRYKYVSIANEYLNISPDTEQIFNIGDFIERYNRNKINTPLKFELKYRTEELSNVEESINQSAVTLISGNAGVGKTRLAIEVCKKFERDGYNVLCITNNGQELFDDIRFYTTTSGKYLLFIDDANMTTSLDFILDRVQNPIENTSIKLLMTVRDYAKNSLVKEIGKFFDLKNHEIILNRFKEKEIRNIIQTNLSIKDSEVLDDICSLAKGNVRAALMAGLSVVEQHKIPDDILKSYYSYIIEAQKLKDKDLITLFVIALLPNISISKDDFAKRILNEFQISITEFNDICKSLSQKEIVDIYLNQLVKINDQSFGDYLLRYILIDKKRIGIKKILKYGFPKYMTRINYALNTLFSIFSNQEVRNYIKDQVNEAWIESDESTQEIYMKDFYQLNPGKTLEIINERIKKLESKEVDVSKLDFSEKDKNQTINNEYISLLGNFKDTPYYEEAVELLCKIFNEKQNLALDVYLAFTYEMKFDTHSYKDDYLRENELIKWLWKYLVVENEANKKNGIYFYLMIVKEFLFVEFQNIESSYNIRSVDIYTIYITYSEGSKKLRAFIWSTLCTIFKENESLKNKIYHIMMTNFGTAVNKENSDFVPIFEWDLKCLSDDFFVKWNNPNLEQAIVMYKLVTKAKKRKIEYNGVMDAYKSNLDFKIYEAFSQKCIGKDYERKQANKYRLIESVIKNYNLEKFGHLFSIMKKIEKFKNNSVSGYEIGSALSWVFRIIKMENNDFYLKVVQKYFENDIPYESNVRVEVIDGIINHSDIYLGLKLIENNNLEDKNVWFCDFFERSPVSFNKDILLDYIRSQAKEKQPLIPRINELEKNIKEDTGFLEELSNLILNSDNNVLMVDSMFRNIDSEQEISKLLSLFENNQRLLKELYILDDKPDFDYMGILLFKLITNDVDYWNRYLMNNKKIIKNDLFIELFKKIWLLPNYKEYIDSFYRPVYDCFFNITRNYMALEEVSKKIFLNSDDVIIRQIL